MVLIYFLYWMACGRRIESYFFWKTFMSIIVDKKKLNALKQKRFCERMKSKGMVLVRMWVPLSLRDKCKEFMKSIGDV